MARKRGKKAKTLKQPTMRITRQRREQIDGLAAALARIAPSTSPGRSFCVRQVAEKMRLKGCWKKQRNKQADIAHLLANLMRRYPRKPKALVLEIVRGGVQWKARKGEQVTEEHLNAIAESMGALGFEIRKELKAIDIPEASRVSHPSQDLVAILDRLDLHKSLKDDIAEMFRDGHFNEAVRKALERFEKRIQDALDDHKTFGRDLMAKTFNERNPQIALNAMKSANDRSEQEGFKFLTMGAMSGMRNLYSHGDVDQMTAIDAIERLVFVSLLFKRIDKAINNKENDYG
ncbi:MAG: TIGR02391 family protein [Deltaproteobacteria bacterium]|nr:MAG: TIGR02391 family protein [Deltaproteobacteria bacterium]